MKLDLWSFLEASKNTLEFQGQLECTNLELSNRDVKIIKPIEYRGEIFKTDGDKAINLNIKYIYEEKCNRCLCLANNKIETSLFAKLLEGKRDSEDEEDGYEEILYYENGILELDEYILEQVIVSLPIKTLCNYDCKGLCPKCGADLNKEKCDCVHENIDPRLEKLKDFFSKD